MNQISSKISKNIVSRNRSVSETQVVQSSSAPKQKVKTRGCRVRMRICGGLTAEGAEVFIYFYSIIDDPGTRQLSCPKVVLGLYSW